MRSISWHFKDHFSHRLGIFWDILGDTCHPYAIPCIDAALGRWPWWPKPGCIHPWTCKTRIAMPARRAGCFRVEFCRFLYHPGIKLGREIPYEWTSIIFTWKNHRTYRTERGIFHYHICLQRVWPRCFSIINGGEHPKKEATPRVGQGAIWLFSGKESHGWGDSRFRETLDYIILINKVSDASVSVCEKMNRWWIIMDQGWTRSSSETLGGSLVQSAAYGNAMKLGPCKTS